MGEELSQIQRVLGVLRRIDFFSKLKMGELEELISNLKKLTCQKGYVIIKEGDPGDSFYMISRGRVSVWKKKGFFGKVKLADLGADQYFGEMALVTHAPRSATIIAEDVCELLVLYKADFKTILMRNPAILQAIQDVLNLRKMKTQITLNQ